MDLTEHLTCTGGAELPGGRAGGLPARPHHPARHGSLPPAPLPLPPPPHCGRQSGGAPPGRREEKGVCCRPDPLQLPEFSHLILPTPLGDGYYYDCPLPLSSAAQRREARGHHESAPGFEPSAAPPPASLRGARSPPGSAASAARSDRRQGVQGRPRGRRGRGRRRAEAERWNRPHEGNTRSSGRCPGVRAPGGV